MAKIPTTSTTLLRDVASDSQHARWTEFAARYRPMMEAYLRERFPSVEADDVIQETLVAVWAALPSYRYAPDEKGHFHNYLTGILRNKALRQLYKEQRHAEIAEMVHDDASCDGRARSQVSPERSEPRKRIRRALRGGRDYSGPSRAQASAESLEVCAPLSARRWSIVAVTPPPRLASATIRRPARRRPSLSPRQTPSSCRSGRYLRHLYQRN